jgi:2-hydroxy-3-oxopropionate reductase
MRKKVGFIGLGTMGRPMARNLLKAGFELFVGDINPAATAELTAEGAKVLASWEEIARTADVVMTMLPNSPDVEKVYLGENGLIQGAHKGLIFVDSSTIDPEVTRRIGQEAEKKGAQMLDAPVGGGVQNAIKGNLIMLVGGEAAALEAGRDVIQAVGDRIIHVGPLGYGLALKLTNNILMATYMFALVEGFSLAHKAGLDRKKLTQLLRENLLAFFDRETNYLMELNFHQGFKTKLAHKDLGLALKMAKGVGAPMPFGSMSREMMEFALNQGCGDLDFTSVWYLYEKKN